MFQLDFFLLLKKISIRNDCKGEKWEYNDKIIYIICFGTFQILKNFKQFDDGGNIFIYFLF